MYALGDMLWMLRGRGGERGPWPQMNSHLGSYGTYELECHLIAYVRYMEKLCAGVLVVRALSG